MTMPEISFGSTLYRKIIEPRQQEQQLRNREKVCNLILVGSVLLIVCLSVLLLLSFSMLHNSYVLGRLSVCVGALLYLVGVYWLSRTGRYRIAAYGLVFFYAILATGSVWEWGINTPFGILMFGLVIVLSSTLLNSRHALYAAVFSGAAIAALLIIVRWGWYVPNDLWQSQNPSFGDVFGYWVEFSVLALVSWLFGREVEHSFARAEKAESALLAEKALLEVRVRERTEELRRLQLEEMQQMYQFAELGQVSTALLHDLANYLTALSFEIEELDKKQYATTIGRTQEIIKHLDNMVDVVRKRIQGRSQVRSFNVLSKIDEVVDLLQYHAVNNSVTLEWKLPQQLRTVRYKGDPFHLTQAITILVANAIDAYHGSSESAHDRVVRIGFEQTEQAYILRIRDQGKGIPSSRRKHLFHPVKSSKKQGMGIGLYLAKQMIVMHFKGTLQLHAGKDYTEFVIFLPKDGHA